MVETWSSGWWRTTPSLSCSCTSWSSSDRPRCIKMKKDHNNEYENEKHSYKKIPLVKLDVKGWKEILKMVMKITMKMMIMKITSQPWSTHAGLSFCQTHNRELFSGPHLCKYWNNQLSNDNENVKKIGILEQSNDKEKCKKSHLATCEPAWSPTRP